MKICNLKHALYTFAMTPLVSLAVTVTVDPYCVRSIGGVTELNRDQYITVHEGFGSSDITEEDVRYMNEELEISYGRDGGVLSETAKDIAADPNNPDMPSLASIIEEAKAFKKYNAPRRLSEPSDMRETFICTHPERMHPMPDNDWTPWGPRTYAGSAEFYAQWFKHNFTDENRPKYLEVLNEPFVHADDIGTTAEAMSELHNQVAKRMRELVPDVKIGGYAAAWVELENNNFEHWNNWQKLFMDIAGPNMDFWSYHIYDGVNVKGNPRNRTGSNSEAIMDLIDTYSHMKFGVAKPIAITEFGLIPAGNMNSLIYSAERSAQMIRSINGQMMTFMDHPDRLLKVVPFTLGKALWTYGMKNEHIPGQANPFLLWRMLEDGSFITTDLVKFYQFWKGVKGDWRKSSSSNPDIRTQCWQDGNRLILALSNLDTKAHSVQLEGLQGLKPNNTSIRTLTTHGTEPILSEKTLEKIPGTIELALGQSTLIILALPEAPEPTTITTEERHYATDYLKDIVADQAISYTIPASPLSQGQAFLRISAGREQGKQRRPSSITLNGEQVEVPSNWAGDDQEGRKLYFGVINAEVPASLIKAENTVTVTYPDTGGKLACVVLQTNTEKSK